MENNANKIKQQFEEELIGKELENGFISNVEHVHICDGVLNSDVRVRMIEKPSYYDHLTFHMRPIVRGELKRKIKIDRFVSIILQIFLE